MNIEQCKNKAHDILDNMALEIEKKGYNFGVADKYQGRIDELLDSLQIR